MSIITVVMAIIEPLSHLLILNLLRSICVQRVDGGHRKCSREIADIIDESLKRSGRIKEIKKEKYSRGCV